MSIAATGMLAQQMNVEVIANNLANMNTTAYKMQRAEFQDLLYQNIERPGSASADTGVVLPAGIQIGVGVRAAATYRITGQIATTGNPYDLAVNGVIHIQMPDGSDAHTRAGATLSRRSARHQQRAMWWPRHHPQTRSVTVNAVGSAGVGRRRKPWTAELARFPMRAACGLSGENLTARQPHQGR
jgi:hypothetical protein